MLLPYSQAGTAQARGQAGDTVGAKSAIAAAGTARLRVCTTSISCLAGPGQRLLKGRSPRRNGWRSRQPILQRSGATSRTLLGQRTRSCDSGIRTPVLRA